MYNYHIAISVNYSRKLVSVQAYNTVKSGHYKLTVAEAYHFINTHGDDKVTLGFHKSARFLAMENSPSHEWDMFTADTVPASEKINAITAYNRMFDAWGFTLLTHKNRK